MTRLCDAAYRPYVNVTLYISGKQTDAVKGLGFGISSMKEPLFVIKT